MLSPFTVSPSCFDSNNWRFGNVPQRLVLPCFRSGKSFQIRKQFRWAEQLTAAALSITNNIAEGSGSFSNAEFAQFLNFSRRSAFETANILILLSREQPLPDTCADLLVELDEICRMLTALRKTLL